MFLPNHFGAFFLLQELKRNSSESQQVRQLGVRFRDLQSPVSSLYGIGTSRQKHQLLLLLREELLLLLLLRLLLLRTKRLMPLFDGDSVDAAFSGSSFQKLRQFGDDFRRWQWQVGVIRLLPAQIRNMMMLQLLQMLLLLMVIGRHDEMRVECGWV